RRQAAHDLLQSAVIIVRQGYGPKPFRREQGWSLEQAEGAARRSIDALSTINDRDVQRIIKEFIDAMRDGHTDITVADRRARALPFDVIRTIDGAYAIAWVDTEQLPPGVALRVGDVVTTFDGRPIAEVMAELARGERQTNPDAAMHSALATLTTRSGASLHDVPELGANVVLGLVGADGKPRAPVTLQWLQSSAVSESPFDAGATEGYPPRLGPIAQARREGDPFASYVYTHNGRRIGYVRISTFSPTDANGNEDATGIEVAFVRRFQARIRELAETTDALVVDLNDSTGGATTVENLLSASLSPVPLRSAVDALRNTARLKEETQARLAALEAGVPRDDLTNLFSNPEAVRRKERAYLTKLLAQLEAGRPWSEPMALDGMAEIPPARHPYRRPVIFLTNPGTASSSETMPAKFQDNRDRRPSAVVGTRTAGWGGTIENVSIPNPFGISSISYTESLSIRMNGTPLAEDITPERLIESRGVIPDRHLALTLNDLRNDFADYRRGVNAVVMEQIHAYERVHGRRRPRSQ
ncbi:MAG TPA: PDZ domain-containing protein, partial [Myxococcota bacterium]|nr:PDZ domain-containing protein [Myxococcota bacterium]